MLQAVDDGLKRTEDIVASAKVSYRRQAYRIHEKAQRVPEGTVKTSLLIKSYGIAVSEQNGSASGYVVTAPTCGSCGVMPAVMYHMREEKLKMARQMLHSDKVPKQIMDKINNELINALAVASYIGNICRANATVSGAEGGCQAEIGVAETMAAAAVCYDAMTTSFHK